MALPVSAPTIMCSLSKPLLSDGTEGVVTAAFLKTDRDLVWVPTGQTIFKDPAPVVVNEDGSLSFAVIPVDAVNMRDAGGNTITHWVYTLRVVILLAGDVTRIIDYMFQPEEAGGPIDLDLIPHVNATILPPVLEPVPSVIDGGTP